MENFIVLDVEADIANQAPYNIGLVVANENKSILAKNFMLLNHMTENSNAMYAAENFAYYNTHKQEFISCNTNEDFIVEFYCIINAFRVKNLYAYNVNFDWKKLCKLIPENELSQILTPRDIMTAAYFAIMDSPDYLNYCRENNYKTEKGYPMATFEVVYRYYTKNSEYKEIHRGLNDALDEYDLLRRLGVKSKNGWKPIQPWRRMGKI